MPTPNHLRHPRILCAGCQEVLTIDPATLEGPLVCSKCGADIPIDAYPNLTKVRADLAEQRRLAKQAKEAAEKAERERLKQEKRERQEAFEAARQRDRERRERERQEAEAARTTSVFLKQEEAAKLLVKCKVCDTGMLERKEVYRMSTFVVLVGWICLAPAILGMGISLFALLAVIVRAGSSADSPPVVVGMSWAVLALIASLVSGLLGWLLTMKKRILQCDHCGAVIPAS
jgi:hypothetical protein